MYLYQVDFRHFLILAKREGLHDGSYVFIGHATAYRGSWRMPLYIEPHLPDDLVYHGVVAIIEDDISPTMEWVNFCNDLQDALLSMNISQKEMMESISSSSSVTRMRLLRHGALHNPPPRRPVGRKFN